MARARLRLNHDDVKNLRHCLEYWCADKDKVELLLQCAWPRLAEKIRRFLGAVRNVWCLQDTQFVFVRLRESQANQRQ